MDPIDRLRALREDSRWTPAEFELDAAPLPVSRPVRGRRVSGADAWRHWLPRVGIGALAAAAVVGLVVAAVNSGLVAPAPAPNLAGPVAPGSSSAIPSTAGRLGPDSPCASDDLQASADVTENPGVTAPFVTMLEIKIVNIGDLCRLGGTPTVNWARSDAAGAATIGAASTPAEPDAGAAAAGDATSAVLHPGDARYVHVTIEPAAGLADCRPVSADLLHLQFPSDHGTTAKLVVKASGAEQKACANVSVQQLSTTGLIENSIRHYAPQIQTGQPTAPSGPTLPCDWSDYTTALTRGAEVDGVTLAEVRFTYAGANTCIEGGAEPTVRWVVGSDGKTQRIGNASSSAMPGVAFTAVGRIVTPGMSTYARIDIDDQGLFDTGDCTGPTPNRLEFVFEAQGAGSSTAIDYVDASLVTSPCAASPRVHLLTYHVMPHSTLQQDVAEAEAEAAAKAAAPTGH